jgi:alpha-beta hydrolase superfamily lysophospholipase
VRARVIDPVRPVHTGVEDGLAYALWLPPERKPTAGLLILHGAGSCKESHYDYARAALALGLAALSFDQRGHGASDGPMDGRVLDDVSSMAALLRRGIGNRAAPIALRGSSMGGYLAILAAVPTRAGAVVAICPASAGGLRRGVERGALGFDADSEALDAFLAGHELEPAVRSLNCPLLLLHAQGDEQVPVQHSRELANAFNSRSSRLIEVPGGHHRSIQHDEELQAVSLRFVEKALDLR